MKQSLKILADELTGIIYSTDYAKINFLNQGKGLSEKGERLITEFENELLELYDKEVELLEKIDLKIAEIEDEERGIS